MPIYEFECSDHGRFELLRGLASYAQAAECPTCEGKATRILSTPHLTVISRGERVARERNEQSSHEPRVSSHSGSGISLGSHKQHRQYEACGHSHEKKPRDAGSPKLTRYTGARPWVIEHS